MGPAVFNTVVGAQAPRRVRFPSASAMEPRRSPLVVVAIVIFFASLLLAFTLPDREPRFTPCPVSANGGTKEQFGCGITIDHRTPERIVIGVVGAALAIVVLSASRRMSRSLEEPPSA